MPHESGKLTDAEFQSCNDKFEGFEKKQGRDLRCEVCDGISWGLNEYLMGLPTDSASGVWGSRARLPLLAYSCVNCGNTKLFPAAGWGIVWPPPPPKAEEKAESRRIKGDGDNGS